MLKSLLSGFILFLAVSAVRGQHIINSTPAELLLSIQKSRPDTNRVKLLFNLGNYYLNTTEQQKDNLDSAFTFLSQASQLSHTIRNLKWQNAVSSSMGDYYLKAGHLEQGKACFIQLINYYRKTGDKAQEARTWNQQGLFYPTNNKNNIATKIRCFKTSMDIFIGLHHPVEAIGEYKNIAQANMNTGKPDLALSQLKSVLSQYKAVGYKKLQDTYSLLAALYEIKKDSKTRLYYELEGVKIAEALHDTISAPYFYHHVASIYTNLGMYAQSAYWLKKSILQNELSDYEDYYPDVFLMNIDLSQLKRYDESLSFLKNAVKKRPPGTLRDKYMVASLFVSTYSYLNQNDRALPYIIKMEALAKPLMANFEPLSAPFFFKRHYGTLARFYIRIKEYKKAGNILMRIDSLPKEVLIPIFNATIARMHFTVDSAMGNNISAFRNLELYQKINDSIFTTTKSKEAAELQVKYDTYKREQSIKILESDSKRQHAELQKANLQRNITFVGIAMLLIIAVLAYYGYRSKQRSNLLLQVKQDEINRQNEFLQHLLTEKDGLLTEKDWLLREVHHRVKNNLQVVMSLLSTQSAYLENKAALEAIKESQNRVQAISLIHQKLYSNSNVASIDMTAYIPDLINYLRDSFDTRGRNISIEQLIDPIKMDLTQAVPLGLILNETITNAIKYAFPGKGGQITVALQLVGTETILLTVTDNGRGLPDDFDIAKSNSLGMEMMKALSKQLAGKFKVKGNPGVTISIAFQFEKVLHANKEQDFYA